MMSLISFMSSIMSAMSSVMSSTLLISIFLMSAFRVLLASFIAATCWGDSDTGLMARQEWRLQKRRWRKYFQVLCNKDEDKKGGAWPFAFSY